MAGLYIKWSYETDSWVDVTYVDFNSKKNPRNYNFRTTRYTTIFLRRIQTLQICKTPQTGLGTGSDETLVYIKNFSLCLSMTYMYYI